MNGEKKSSRLNEKDYLDLLNGKKNAGGYQRDYFVVKQEKNPTKAEILLNGRVGLPHNMDEEHEKNLVKPKKRKRDLHPELLRLFR